MESLVAVTVVAALVLVLLLLFGDLSPSTMRSAARPTPPASPASSANPAATSPSPPTPGPTAAATTSPGIPAASPPATLLPVLVLNNSRIKGLAARAADIFRSGGWPVLGTGNLRGRVPVTTVYYPGGEEAAARLFAARFPAVRRVLPRPAGLPGSGLTVVVTREFPT